MGKIKSTLSSIDFKTLHIDYADIRVEEVVETYISYLNSELKEASESPSLGAFLRVFHGGNWIYKSTTDLSSLQEAFEELATMAKTLPSKNQQWPKRSPLSYENAHYQDIGCHRISLKNKKEICEKILPILSGEALLQAPAVRYKDMYKKKWFRSSDEREFYYDYSQAGLAISYTLKKQNQIFEDSKSFFITTFNHAAEEIAQQTRQRIEEAKLFIDAPTITPGKYKVVLDSDITGVFTHESFGHKSEADFMLGDPKMKEEWEIGKKVGSDILSIVDEGCWPETTGYLPIDDEGNIKEKTYLIKNGRLAGRLHSTMTAEHMHEQTTGNARSINFMYEPIVRMSNTYIEAKDKDFSELIKNIDKGVYLKGFNYGTGMSTFTIAPQMAYLIENGKIMNPVKVSVLTGSVFETLNNVVDIGNDFQVFSSAIGGCGKMEQWPLPVADGGPSIVVEGMNLS